MTLQKPIVFSIFFLLPTSLQCSFGAEPSASTSLAAPLPANAITCPLIKDIRKDPTKLIWRNNTAEFQSYDKSFAIKLKRFLGAQWSGANVGQIICLYLPENKFVFPVMLYYKTLSFQPKGYNWEAASNGVSNCKAIDSAHPITPTNCPFVPRVVQNAKDIDKIAEQLRDQTDPSADEPPGF